MPKELFQTAKSSPLSSISFKIGKIKDIPVSFFKSNLFLCLEFACSEKVSSEVAPTSTANLFQDQGQNYPPLTISPTKCPSHSETFIMKLVSQVDMNI